MFAFLAGSRTHTRLNNRMLKDRIFAGIIYVLSAITISPIVLIINKLISKAVRLSCCVKKLPSISSCQDNLVIHNNPYRWNSMLYSGSYLCTSRHKPAVSYKSNYRIIMVRALLELYPVLFPASPELQHQ